MIPISEFKKYMFLHVYSTKLLLPTGHLSTSRTPPYIHTLPLASINLERLSFYLWHQKNTIREKHISVSNEQDDVLMLNRRVIIIYGDSVAHTTDPRSNIQSVLAAADFHIVGAFPVMSGGFVLTCTFSFSPKFVILLFTSLCFFDYVNDTTFLLSVGIILKLSFRFLIPKYRG